MDKFRTPDYSNNELCINKESLFKVPKLSLCELKQIKKFLTGEDCNYTIEFNNNTDILVINMSNYTTILDDNKFNLISPNNCTVPINKIEVKELVLDFNNNSDEYCKKHHTAQQMLGKICSKKRKLTIWNEEIVVWSLEQKKHDMATFQMVLCEYPILKILEFTCCNSIYVNGGIFLLEELIFINCSYINVDDSNFEFKHLKTIILVNCGDTIIFNLKMKKLTTLKIFNSRNITFKKNDIVIENLIIDDSVNTDKLPLANSTQIINYPFAKEKQ